MVVACCWSSGPRSAWWCGSHAQGRIEDRRRSARGRYGRAGGLLREPRLPVRVPPATERPSAAPLLAEQVELALLLKGLQRAHAAPVPPSSSL
eukprot:3569330-Prymnesium_polylepis.1